MRVTLRILILTGAALLAAVPDAAAAAQAEEGAWADPGRWHVRGGSTARRGVSTARPPRGPVTVAWERDLGGPVEDEPLGWDQQVVVTVRASDDRRSLHVLDLATGAPLVEPPTWETDVELEPSLWGGRIAVRTARRRVEVLQREGGKLVPIWEAGFDAEVGPPLLVGDELLLCHGDRFECFVLGADPDEPRWSLEGRFRGAPSRLGDELWVTEYDEEGVLYLSRVSADGDRLPCRQGLGWHRDRLVLKPVTGQGVSLLPDGVVAVSYGAYLAEVEGKVRFALLRPDLSGTSTHLGLLPVSALLRTPVAAWDGGWLGLVTDGGEGLDLAAKPRMEGTEYTRLAGAGLHEALVARPVPPTVAGGLALMGAHAFEVESGRLLWSVDRQASTRAVPLGRRVLFGADDTLVCVAAAEPDDAPVLGSDAAGVLAGGVLVLRDGTVVTDDLQLTAGAGTVTVARRGRNLPTWNLEDVLLVADADGVPRWSRDEASLARGTRFLVARELAGDWSELAADAVDTQDLELARAMLRAARRAGADAEQLKDPVRDLARLERKSRRRVDDDRVDEVRARRDELDARLGPALWQRVEALPAETSATARLALVLEVLAVMPEHPAARRALLDLLPSGLRDVAAADPVAWVPFARAAVEREWTARTEADDSPAGRALESARRTWREALLAVAGPRVVVVGAAGADKVSPDNLARALAVGELVCDALEGLLPELAAAAAPDADRVVIRLYPSSRDYLVLAEPGDQGTEAGLGWRPVHFDAAAGVVHLSLPDPPPAEAGGWPEVVPDGNPDRALAHHLARLWLRRTVDGDGPGAQLPGLWLEVGTAALADELVFDVHAGRWRRDPGLTPRLDLLTALDAEQLMPWSTLMNMSEAALPHIERQLGPLPAVPSATNLGPTGPVGRRNLFYTQSMVLLGALLDDETARPQVIEALSAYMAGDDPGLAPATAFDEGAVAWGQRALQAAREAVGR